MKIGILTGGGDCPGLNAVIRAITKKAIQNSYTVIGIKYGWKGILEKDCSELDLRGVSGILHRGGTILGTSRTNPYNIEGGPQRVKENMKALGISVLVVVGGEDTLGVAARFHSEGVNVVGVPKTIDNDLSATDFTFGFDTAINIVTDCIDRLHTTAESHNRVMVVEVMGRHAGWIATYGGMAGGADYILIPEIPVDVDELCDAIKRRHETGKNFSIVVVAEGAMFKDKQFMTQDREFDEFGHVRLGGIGQTIGKLIEQRTGFETRATVLGHIQRGGSPTAFDRVLGTRFGIKAVELLGEKRFGRMAALQGNEIVDVPLVDATSKIKTVDMKLYDIAKIFFG